MQGRRLVIVDTARVADSAGRLILERLGDKIARPNRSPILAATVGGSPPWGDNVTPAPDYRTARLSDSPDAGVRYALRWER